MSVRAIAWAFDQELDATAKFVLVALCDHASDDGACWVSNKTLQRKTSLSERAVRAATTRLQGLGLIQSSPRYHQSGDRLTNLWELVGWSESPGISCPTPRHVVPHPGAPDAPKPLYEPSTKPKQEDPWMEHPAFREAWAQWESYRKEKRAPLTPHAVTLQMKKLREQALTPNEAVRWIESSILRGYRGVFPPPGITSQPKPPAQRAIL